MSVSPTEADVRSLRPRTATIGQRLDSRQLRYIAGNRLPAGLVDTTPAGAGRIRVIGPDDLLNSAGGPEIGARSVDRLQFTREMPAGRLTEPGDVVFCTSPRPRAMVDREGLSVVEYPARILRIRPHGDDELLPDILVADVNARSRADVTWRSWPTRGIDPLQRSPLSAALAELRDARDAALLRLARLHELEAAVIDGVTHSQLSLSVPLAPDDSARSNGHH